MVGLVSYFDETGAGHVLNDGFWTPAKEDPAGWSTVSIGSIDIFVGFTAKALDDLGFTSSLLSVKRTARMRMTTTNMAGASQTNPWRP